MDLGSVCSYYKGLTCCTRYNRIILYLYGRFTRATVLYTVLIVIGRGTVPVKAKRREGEILCVSWPSWPWTAAINTALLLYPGIQYR